jgi:hypothetical protein
MKQNFAGMLLAFAVPVILYSCKKAAIEPTPLQAPQTVTENLRSWAKAQDAVLAFQKVKVDGKTVSVPQYPVLESSQYFPAERINITPVQVGNTRSGKPAYKYLVTELGNDGKINNGNYYVVLTDKKTESDLAITPGLLKLTEIPGDFNGTIMKYDLNNNIIFTKHYEKGALTNKNANLVSKKAKPAANGIKEGPAGSYAPLNPGCEYVYIDWYYQVYENGVLIYEEYLETTAVVYCEEGGGGGSGNQTCEEQLQNTISQGHAISGTVFGHEDYNDGITMQKSYNWAIFTHGTYGLLSYEKGFLEKINYPGNITRWEFIDFQHVKIEKVGFTIGCISGYNFIDKTINISPTRMKVDVRIDFSIIYVVPCSFVQTPVPFNANQNFYAPNTVVYY